MIFPVTGSTYCPTSKKKGTFQMWCSPNGRSARSTTPYSANAVAGLPAAAQCENTSICRPTGGHRALSTSPTNMAAKAVRIGTDRLPEKKPR